MPVYAPARAISLLDSVGRAKSGRVSGLEQQIATHTPPPSLCFPVISGCSQYVKVYVCSWGSGVWACLIPVELVSWGEMLAQGGSVKSKAGGLKDLGWGKMSLVVIR